ncbi:hypothetical protein U8607_24270 [Methylobacterium durans]|uniref:hypothetical protein n=1 Tax=Methylobacterium durans TaxID=2202825 RepID=UPI002AFE5D03|nr:hypothetical protein [Methylobacterium durans]MEA1835206.1 hypothetical protein [Methylobacterium durans]
MERLRDIRAERLIVECCSCRRSGSYRIAGLVVRFGADISQLDLLAALTASCRHQSRPGSTAPRKYEVNCQARLILPPSGEEAMQTLSGARPVTIEIWRPNGRGIQWHAASIWNLSLAHEVFETAVKIWLASLMTLRQGIRIVEKHRMPD